MPSSGAAKPVAVQQPQESELGAFVYEARLPWWLRILFTAIVLPVVAVSTAILIRRWADLDWIAWVAFVFCALVLPFVIADGWIRRVRFYDHGLAARNWAFQTRILRYSDVISVGRAQDLRIHQSTGAVVNIPKWHGDFDSIEDILRKTEGTETEGN